MYNRLQFPGFPILNPSVQKKYTTGDCNPEVDGIDCT